jgi:hypothetical protein
LQICRQPVVVQQRVIYVEQKHDASRRLFVHFSLGSNTVPLIAEGQHVRYAKMQPEGNKDAVSWYRCDGFISLANRPPDSKSPLTLPLI